MRRFEKNILALLIVISSLYYFFSFQEVIEKRFVYPFEYKEYIVAGAGVAKVEPPLIAAIILAESKFDKTAVSERGAVGLMQIMPDTAKWIAESKEMKDYDVKKLKEPEVNIELGTWYVGYLMKVFNGNPVLVLAAYNAGRGHVEEWIEEYHWTKDFSNIDEIPFAETRMYVKAVLSNMNQYKRLYNIK